MGEESPFAFGKCELAYVTNEGLKSLGTITEWSTEKEDCDRSYPIKPQKQSFSMSFNAETMPKEIFDLPMQKLQQQLAKGQEMLDELKSQWDGFETKLRKHQINRRERRAFLRKFEKKQHKFEAYCKACGLEIKKVE